MSSLLGAAILASNALHRASTLGALDLNIICGSIASSLFGTCSYLAATCNMAVSIQRIVQYVATIRVSERQSIYR